MTTMDATLALIRSYEPLTPLDNVHAALALNMAQHIDRHPSARLSKELQANLDAMRPDTFLEWLLA